MNAVPFDTLKLAWKAQDSSTAQSMISTLRSNIGVCIATIFAVWPIAHN